MGYIAIVVAWIAVVLATLTGWVMNIMQIIEMWGGEFTLLLLAKLIGVPVFILGALLGYLG